MKGKLYITFAASLKGGIEHTDVYHGVREENVDNLVQKKSGREIISYNFKPIKPKNINPNKK